MTARRQDGEPWRRSPGNGRGKPNEKPETTGPVPGANHSGTLRDGKRRSRIGLDDLVVVEKVLRNFDENTPIRFKPKSRRHCHERFRALAADQGLTRFTKRQLKGPKGAKLLKAHLAKVGHRSRQVYASNVRAVWVDGLGLDWPLRRGDLGKFGRPRRRRSPLDEKVRPWAQAVIHDPDIYLRMLVLLVLCFGLRPSQVANLRWRDLRRDASGVVDAILCDDADGEDKSDAILVAWLPPLLRETVSAWAKIAPSAMPNAHLVPFRDCKGRVSARGQSPDAVRKWWGRFALKWSLPTITTRPGDVERTRPELTMVLVRHWVKSSARKAGVSKPARLAMQGHGFDPGDMDDRYDNPEVEELVDDQQVHLPEGTVGRVLAGGGPPLVQVMFEGVPKDAVALLHDYFEPGSQLTTREAWDRLEAIRLRAQGAGPVGA